MAPSISAVVATFAIGFCLNHFALRRQTCTPLRQTRKHAGDIGPISFITSWMPRRPPSERRPACHPAALLMVSRGLCKVTTDYNRSQIAASFEALAGVEIRLFIVPTGTLRRFRNLTVMIAGKMHGDRYTVVVGKVSITSEISR